VSLLPNNVQIESWRYDKLLLDNLTVNVSIGLSSATVQLTVLNVELLDLEYSFDNLTWQTSNIFPSQIAGNYTIYIKDQFGCLISKAFIIDEQGTREPYFFMSNSSAIPFVEQVDTDECTNYKTSKNSFSLQDLVRTPYSFPIIYNACDSTRIQFKSNYANNDVKRRNEDGTETVMILDKLSNNLSRYEKLDCTYYRAPSGKLAIYYSSGNVYNELGDVIGQHQLEGKVPDFAVAGNSVVVEGQGTFVIESIETDAAINKRIIVFNQVYTGIAVTSKSTSIYDLLPYEIYEFECDFSNFILGLNDIHITCLSATGETLDYLSENIDVQTTHENTVAIRYFDKNNRDVFYKFGIEHFIRVEVEDSEAGFKDDSGNNITDEQTTLTESFLNEKTEFNFELLTTSQFKRLYIALSKDFLYINNEGFVKNGPFSTERQENTNLYSLSADLIKSGATYSNKESGYSGTDGIEVPNYVGNLLVSGTNFIKLN